MAEATLAGKLRVAPGGRVWVSDPGLAPLLGALPDGAVTVAAPDGADVLVAFARDAAAVRGLLDAHRDAMAAAPVVWVAYPKGNAANINRDTLWPILAERGFRPIGQVAIDATWSALRFRLLKPGEAQFTGGR